MMNAAQGTSMLDSSGQIAVILLVDFHRSALLRAFARLAFGRYRLAKTPGMTFLKVLGSGRNGGFRPIPSFSHQGLFASFVDETAADAFLAGDAVAAYRADARELFTAKLRAYQSRGSWSGKVPLAVTEQRPDSGPIASLTRASIKPGKAAAFWTHAPPSERSLHRMDGCLVAAGLGEAPLLRQATFTIWEDLEAMRRFAHTGAHLEAIKRARDGDFFSEDLFAQFVPSAMEGAWAGQSFGAAAAAG